MAWIDKYEFGRTYYSIMDIQLTEAEGKRAERHQFGSVLKQAEEWNTQYLRCNEGECPFDELPEQPEGYQYWVKINDLYGQMPEQLTSRELEIVSIARMIGYVEAMAEQKLWYDLGNEPTLQAARDGKKVEYESTNRKLKERYLALLGPLAKSLPGPFPNNEDLSVRDDLSKEFNMKRRTVNNRLIKMNLRKSVPKSNR